MKPITLLSFFGILLFSCDKNKEKELTKCGCDSPALKEWKDKEGELIYDSTLTKYLIYINNPGTVQGYFILCGQENLDTLDNNIELPLHVVFTGNEKQICSEDRPVTVHNFAYLTLTKINTQSP